MIRWVKQPDGSFKHDFSIVDRYMDLYAQKCGDPGIVCLNVWGHASWSKGKQMPIKAVTVFDPATKKLSALKPPPRGTPENEKFWRPALTELRKRLEKRGWFKRTAVLYTSYCTAPSKKMVDVYSRIWPDGKWMNCSHVNPRVFKGSKGSMPVAYVEWVWGCGRLYDPGLGRGKYPRPWKQARIELGNPRTGVQFIWRLASMELVGYRFVSEGAMQGNLDGLGKLGADFWPCISDKRGRRHRMDVSRFGVGFNNSVQAMLSPGKNGAVFNARLEMFREGMQIVEAIICLQRGLESGKLDATTSARIKKLLDRRARHYLTTRGRGDSIGWVALECSGWQDRDRELFALAAEVSAKSRRGR
jgi:hypothetical protein